MKRTSYTCDRCKAENIQNDVGWISLQLTRESFGPTRTDLHLCRGCAGMVEAVIGDRADVARPRCEHLQSIFNDCVDGMRIEWCPTCGACRKGGGPWTEASR